MYVGELGERPMVYRFRGKGSTYGPRPLKLVVQFYGESTECEAAPEDQLPSANPWRPVVEWAEAYKASPVAEEQTAELQKLGVAFDASRTTTAEAAEMIRAAKVRAAEMRRASNGAKKPTPKKLNRLRSLGIEPPENADRAAIDKLIDAAELAVLVGELRKMGASFDGPPTRDAAEDFAEGFESLTIALKEARARGLRIEQPQQMTLVVLEALVEALERFWSEAGDLHWLFQDIVERGALRQLPTDSQIKGGLTWMFERIKTGLWSSSESDLIAFAKHIGVT